MRTIKMLKSKLLKGCTPKGEILISESILAFILGALGSAPYLLRLTTVWFLSTFLPKSLTVSGLTYCIQVYSKRRQSIKFLT